MSTGTKKKDKEDPEAVFNHVKDANFDAKKLQSLLEEQKKKNKEFSKATFSRAIYRLIKEYSSSNVKDEDGADIIQVLVDEGADVNCRVEDGDEKDMFPLYQLCDDGDYPVTLKKLLDLGADATLTYPGFEDRTTLHLVAYRGSRDEAFKILNDISGLLNLPDKSGETPLFSALRGNEFDYFKDMVEKGADINHKNLRGATCLMLAAQLVRKEIFNFLLGRPDIAWRLQDGEGETVLFYSLQSWDPMFFIQAVVQKDNEYLEKLKHDDTGAGIKKNDKSEDQGSLNKKAKEVSIATIENDAKQSLLMSCASRGYREITEFLLDKCKVDKDAQDNDGMTALMYAAQSGSSDVLRVLLTHKANPNLKDENKRIALEYAVESGSIDCMKMLLTGTGEDGAEMDEAAKAVLRNVVYANGITPFMRAISNNVGEDMLLKFLEAGVEVNQPDAKKRTAIIYVGRYNAYPIIKKMVGTYKAVVDHQDVFERTALMYAAKNGDTNTVEQLLANGAKAGPGCPKDNDGWTALTYAAYFGCTACVRQLVSAGAAVDERDDNGLTPWQWAAWRGVDTETIDELMVKSESDLKPRMKGFDANDALILVKYFVRERQHDLDVEKICRRASTSPIHAALQFASVFRTQMNQSSGAVRTSYETAVRDAIELAMTLVDEMQRSDGIQAVRELFERRFKVYDVPLRSQKKDHEKDAKDETTKGDEAEEAKVADEGTTEVLDEAVHYDPEKGKKNVFEIALDLGRPAGRFFAHPSVHSILRKTWRGEQRTESLLENVFVKPFSRPLDVNVFRPGRNDIFFGTARGKFVMEFIFFCAFIGFFTLAINHETQGPNFWDCVLLVYLLGFIVSEGGQAIQEGLDYFNNPWNVADLIMIFIFFFYFTLKTLAVALDDGSLSRTAYHTMAFNSIFLWTRVLNTCDLHAKLGPLLTIVKGMVFDLVTFLFLMLMVMIGFSQALYTLMSCDLEDGNNNCDADLTWIGSFFMLFRSILGESYFEDVSTYASVIGTLLYGLYLSFSVILLLNLLIAIFGATHARISEDAEDQFNYSRASTYLDYADRVFVVPPFNLATILLIPFTRVAGIIVEIISLYFIKPFRGPKTLSRDWVREIITIKGNKVTFGKQEYGSSVFSSVTVPSSCGVFYFEVKVLSDSTCSIGFAGPNQSVVGTFGENSGTFGYKNDGEIVANGSTLGTSEKFGTGVVVGAGVDFDRQEVFFTRAGTLCPTRFKAEPESESHIKDLKATLYGYEKAAFEVNMNASKFAFNIDAHPEFKGRRKFPKKSPLPTEFSNKVVRDLIKLSADGTEVLPTEVPSTNMIISAKPFSTMVSLNYFEVEFITGDPFIGVGVIKKTVPLMDHTISRDEDAFSYFSDDGCWFPEAQGTMYGAPSWDNKGDIAGVGIDISLKEIFITKNGEKVATHEVVKPDFLKDLYPMLYIRNSANVKVNFGQTPFKYAPMNSKAAFLKKGFYRYKDLPEEAAGFLFLLSISPVSFLVWIFSLLTRRLPLVATRLSGIFSQYMPLADEEEEGKTIVKKKKKVATAADTGFKLFEDEQQPPISETDEAIRRLTVKLNSIESTLDVIAEGSHGHKKPVPKSGSILPALTASTLTLNVPTAPPTPPSGPAIAAAVSKDVSGRMSRDIDTRLNAFAATVQTQITDVAKTIARMEQASREDFKALSESIQAQAQSQSQSQSPVAVPAVPAPAQASIKKKKKHLFT